uniref:GDSL esterase/lipase At3g48460-like n=1 Tax=Elaeis guineensis var. tenera TaxID=51953 RepID=A0A8N4EY85_ELAGV|nr:GDSL esterase/lipase At3g48460-like [Elaeis guineensis]
MVSSNSLHTTIIFFLLLNLLPSSFSTSSSTAGTTDATSTTGATHRHHFSKIYAFGDSFTDTGNTHSITGPYSFGHVSSPPYGSTFFHHSTNRYSDGRLVVDFLATDLSLPFLPPYLVRSSNFSHGVNFAVAGSTAIAHEFFAQNNVTMDITPQSLMTQLIWFEKYLEGKGCRGKGSRRCQAEMEDALFWVGEIGANDYAYSFTSSLSPNLIRELAIKNVHNFLQALLDNGAKYMVVQGLPLTGCLPLSMVLAPPDDRDGIGCAASVNNQSYTHNLLLQNKLRDLRRRYPNAIISYADYFSAHLAVMKNPATHGFTEPYKACCGSGGGSFNFDLFATCGSPNVSKACSNPTKFVNWDGVHLTEAMYKVVSDMFLHRRYCRPSFDVLLRNQSH